MSGNPGRIMDISAENRPIPGCTVSNQIFRRNGASITVFSLASGTDISAEKW